MSWKLELEGAVLSLNLTGDDHMSDFWKLSSNLTHFNHS